jgi:hypothetical protein
VIAATREGLEYRWFPDGKASLIPDTRSSCWMWTAMSALIDNGKEVRSVAHSSQEECEADLGVFFFCHGIVVE